MDEEIASDIIKRAMEENEVPFELGISVMAEYVAVSIALSSETAVEFCTKFDLLVAYLKNKCCEDWDAWEKD